MSVSELKCRKCRKAWPADEMLHRAGKPSSVCLECWRKSLGAATKSKTPKKSVKQKKTSAAKAVAVAEPSKIAAVDSPALRMEAGYGIDAKIDDGYLLISQVDQEGSTDTLLISRSEAVCLFEMFREWAAT